MSNIREKQSIAVIVIRESAEYRSVALLNTSEYLGRSCDT